MRHDNYPALALVLAQMVQAALDLIRESLSSVDHPEPEVVPELDYVRVGVREPLVMRYRTGAVRKAIEQGAAQHRIAGEGEQSRYDPMRVNGSRREVPGMIVD
jgi:hypothetical protein